jgi:hypothetical protein
MTHKNRELAAAGVHLFVTFPQMCTQSYLVQLQKKMS